VLSTKLKIHYLLLYYIVANIKYVLNSLYVGAVWESFLKSMRAVLLFVGGFRTFLFLATGITKCVRGRELSPESE
jgi:hypothetical protein